VPAGAGLKPKSSRLGPVRTIIVSNSGQERRRLFGQHPQAHEELLDRKIVERSDVEIDILRKRRADHLQIISGLVLSDALNDRRPVLRKVLGKYADELLADRPLIRQVAAGGGVKPPLPLTIFPSE
jgi:hypothetical protein